MSILNYIRVSFLIMDNCFVKKDIMNKPLTVLGEITPQILKKLKLLHIETVGDLAKQNVFSKKIPSSYRIVTAAKKFLKADLVTTESDENDENDGTETESDPIDTDTNFDMFLNALAPKDTKDIEVITKKKKKTQTKSIVPDVKSKPLCPIKTEPPVLTMTVMQDHSWFEKKIIIPTEQGQMDPAVIYDMTIDPNNRVAFICSWISTGDTEEVADMTYSPQILYHYNLDLPELKIGMSKQDYDSLPNKWTIQNVMWETNTMRNSQIL